MFKEIIKKIKNKIIRMLGGCVYLEEVRIIKNVRKTEYDITPLRAEITCLKDKHVNLELTSEDISRIKENLMKEILEEAKKYVEFQEIQDTAIEGLEVRRYRMTLKVVLKKGADYGN